MYQDIARNRRNSALLVGGVIGLVSAVGYVYGQMTGDAWSGLVFALGASLVGTGLSWFGGDVIALTAAGAQHIERKEQLPEVWNMLENLSITAGLPMPKLYLVQDPSPNAFATGRDPAHASIAVTTGLLERLDRVELEGVLAHELAHVQNYDTRWMVLVGVLVGSLTLLSDLFFRFGAGRRSDRSGNAGAMLMIVGIVLLILAPIIGQVIKLAISRKREFLADASGALLTRYPEGLASALEKISQTARPMERASDATAHLWIASPFADGTKKPSFVHRLFSTHPPIEERVTALRAMGH
ncbi:MAG: heat shock protein HtpX [Patescibacteria group bacterium]|nr:heat shock protein HtpX [Patescibacteria group bacterium]